MHGMFVLRPILRPMECPYCGMQAGKLEPTIKSEEPPASNIGPVKVVTAKTFDEIVHSGNDVLLEFYAPW